MKNKREVLVKLFLSTLYLSAFTFGGKTAGCDTGNIPWRGGVLYGM